MFSYTWRLVGFLFFLPFSSKKKKKEGKESLDGGSPSVRNVATKPRARHPFPHPLAASTDQPQAVRSLPSKRSVSRVEDAESSWRVFDCSLLSFSPLAPNKKRSRFFSSQRLWLHPHLETKNREILPRGAKRERPVLFAVSVFVSNRNSSFRSKKREEDPVERKKKFCYRAERIKR